MSTHDLADILVEPLVRRALEEDLGRAGDITSASVIPETAQARGLIHAREAGTLAGLQPAMTAFLLIDPTLTIEIGKHDGDELSEGDVIATVSGRARSLLTAERVALNFLGHLSGIASATAGLVAAVREAGAHVKTRITDTRKTTPGLRLLEKQAVLLGGGSNHRFGLDDAILIKDNHIAVAGSITAALTAAKARAGHMVRVEIEVDTLKQLEEALDAGAEVVLLDNMSVAELKEAVRLNAGRAVLEASGGITLDSVPAIAATGVDYVSSGAITHSAPALDVGLDFSAS